MDGRAVVAVTTLGRRYRGWQEAGVIIRGPFDYCLNQPFGLAQDRDFQDYKDAQDWS